MTEIIVPNKRNTAVFINDCAVPAVLSFYIEEKAETHIVRELLSGETADRILLGTQYLITLTTASEDFSINTGDPSDIRIVMPESVKLYQNCTVVKSEEGIDENGEYIMKHTFMTNQMIRDNVRGEER